jgi:hypothetical protein
MVIDNDKRPTMMRFFFALAFLFGAANAAHAAHAESSHLWNDGAGSGQCLDIVNDGVNDWVRMSSCAKVSGQYWELIRLRRHGRAFQLTNLFTGPSRCLAASAEGLRLRACDRSPDQQWSSEWTISG